jgi:2,3-bisphosphoglycerate-independent phosphoglycerate mutase
MKPDTVQTFDEIACQEGAYGTLEKDEFIRTLLGNARTAL